ncbi:Delta2-dienoyl-CoA-isomerase, partial [Flagelloscypha sp. PMI_526]
VSSFSTDLIQVSEPSPGIAHVELNRPPVNAGSHQFWLDYGLVFTRLAREAGHIRVAVLSSKLPKYFTAGLDLKDLGGGPFPAPGTKFDSARQGLIMRDFIREFQAAIGSPEQCPFPVIAAVHGHAIGLACDIIGPCDIRYAASNATFSIKEVDIGLCADVGSLAFLPKIGGNQSLLRELAYTGRSFSAQEALAAGFLSKVVDGGRDEVIAAAFQVAEVIASKSPVPIVGTKRVLLHSRDHTVADNLEYVATWNANALQTEVSKKKQLLRHSYVF